LQVLLDENLDVRLVGDLNREGHDVSHDRQTPLRGKEDPEVLEFARNEGRVMITLDSDFSNITRFPPARFSGIIRLRLNSIRYASVRLVLVKLLRALEGVPLEGRLVVATEVRFRIR
jgi:predicted nuclease of predicted toxin-antitoxin system